MKKALLLAILSLGLLAASPKKDNIKLVPTAIPSIEKVYIASKVDTNIASTQSKNARLDQEVTLYTIIESELNGKKVYFGDLDSVEIKDKKIYPKRWDENYGSIDIDWFKVESMLGNYPEKADISYKETKQKWRKWSNKANAHPSDKRIDLFKGLGTMRFKINIKYNNLAYSTAGKESVDEFGIKKNVHRISFRKDDTEIGWAYAWCNLPYQWGSRSINDQLPAEQHQTERFIAQDCADLVVGAARFSGKNNLNYTWSNGLESQSNIVTEIEGMDENLNFLNKYGNIIRYGNKRNEVRLGDKLLGQRHVGILARDSGSRGKPDGILNAYDIMFHTLFDYPQEVYLGEHPPLKILRWK